MALGLLFSSCGYSEKDAEKVAEDFLIAYQYGLEDELEKKYPQLTSFTRPTVIDKFEIKKVDMKEKNFFWVYSNVKPYKNKDETRDLILEVKTSADGNLFIKNSKGLASYNSFDYKERFELLTLASCIDSYIWDRELGKAMQNGEKIIKDLSNQFNNSFDINKDIDFTVKVQNNRYSEDNAVLTINNRSPYNFTSGDLYCSVHFYNSRKQLLDTYNFSSFVINVSAFSTVSINTNVGFTTDYFSVPYDAQTYDSNLNLKSDNIKNIVLNNKNLFKLNCYD